MNRERINRVCAVGPVALSILAFGLALIGGISGFAQPAHDEGAAAHVFQLLIVAEAPFIFGYFFSANWEHLRRVALTAGLDLAALALAFAPVFYYHL